MHGGACGTHTKPVSRGLIANNTHQLGGNAKLSTFLQQYGEEEDRLLPIEVLCCFWCTALVSDSSVTLLEQVCDGGLHGLPCDAEGQGGW